MTDDSRIPQYRKAVSDMTRGQFHVALPAGQRDEVDRLGADLQQLARTLDRRFDEMRALARVTEKINAGLLVTEVLDHVFDSFRSFIPYNRMGFALLEERPGRGTSVRAHWARSDAPDMKIRADYVAPLAGSSLERIIDTGEPRMINDLVQYLEAHPDSASTRLIVEEGMRSSLTCPLIAMGRPVGFLFFTSMRADTYRDVHVGIFQEIAGQLSIIVEKSRLYQSLLELNEMKDKFLGMAAHDLRSPIIAIMSYMDLITGGFLGEVQTQQRDVLYRMEETCHKMLRLIEDLLDVSAIESGHLNLKRAQVDVGPYLRNVCTANTLLAGHKSIGIELEAGSLPAADFDPVRIEQVLDNLISNAVKYSNPGTKVKVSAAVEGDELVIAVTDQGQGIPAADLQHLFTVFGRTSVSPTCGEPSTGLGLAIVKRLVEAHGGRVWVKSTPGAGSTFTFALPLAAGD